MPVFESKVGGSYFGSINERPFFCPAVSEARSDDLLARTRLLSDASSESIQPRRSSLDEEYLYDGFQTTLNRPASPMCRPDSPLCQLASWPVSTDSLPVLNREPESPEKIEEMVEGSPSAPSPELQMPFHHHFRKAAHKTPPMTPLTPDGGGSEAHTLTSLLGVGPACLSAPPSPKARTDSEGVIRNTPWDSASETVSTSRALRQARKRARYPFESRSRTTPSTPTLPTGPVSSAPPCNSEVSTLRKTLSHPNLASAVSTSSSAPSPTKWLVGKPSRVRHNSQCTQTNGRKSQQTQTDARRCQQTQTWPSSSARSSADSSTSTAPSSYSDSSVQSSELALLRLQIEQLKQALHFQQQQHLLLCSQISNRSIVGSESVQPFEEQTYTMHPSHQLPILGRRSSAPSSDAADCVQRWPVHQHRLDGLRVAQPPWMMGRSASASSPQLAQVPSNALFSRKHAVGTFRFQLPSIFASASHRYTEPAGPEESPKPASALAHLGPGSWARRQVGPAERDAHPSAALGVAGAYARAPGRGTMRVARERSLSIPKLSTSFKARSSSPAGAAPEQSSSRTSSPMTSERTHSRIASPFEISSSSSPRPAARRASEA